MSHRQTIYFNEKHFTYYSLDGGKRLTYHVHGSYLLGFEIINDSYGTRCYNYSSVR